MASMDFKDNFEVEIEMQCSPDAEKYPFKLLLSIEDKDTFECTILSIEKNEEIIGPCELNIPKIILRQNRMRTFEYTITKIDKEAFKNCNYIDVITIPDSVTSIGIGAFEGCSNLTSINIPFGVESIYKGTFFNCSKFCTSKYSLSVLSYSVSGTLPI